MLLWVSVRIPFLTERSGWNEATATKCFEKFLFFFNWGVCNSRKKSQCCLMPTSLACESSLGLQLFSKTNAKSGGFKVRIFKLKKSRINVSPIFRKIKTLLPTKETLNQIKLIMLYSTLLCFVTNAKIHDLWSCRVSVLPQPNSCWTSIYLYKPI